jgi:hypothetical protein
VRMLGRSVLLAAALALSSGMAFATASPAGAVQPETCATTNTAPVQPAFACLNAWSGGPLVKTEDPGTSNENFTIERVAGRCAAGSQLTTSGCPIAGIPAGFLIVQIRHGSQCVDDLNGSSTDAHVGSTGTCNNVNTGQGGSFGTIYVYGTPGCPTSSFPLWSAKWSTSWPNSMGGLNYNGGGPGQQFWQNVHNVGACLMSF